MNDNLPEINFKEKKEKKRGLLGWLRSKLGIGSRGGAMGEAGMNPSAMNVGRALGTAKFGASAGLGGFISGNIGAIVTAAVVAVAGGVYLANNAPAPTTGNSAFSSNKSPDNYVPAILRSQAANQGSSLEMFKDTNKDAGLGMEEGANKPKPEDAKASANDEEKTPDANQAAPDQSNMAESMMGKLQGGNIGSLTSSMGGGGNKMSAMGGFGNKFSQKSDFTSGIGTGFQGLAKFDQRKGKMMAMKATSRPVFKNAKAGTGKKFGAGAMNQAKGLRDTQKSYTGTSIDSARSTQDKAWEGSTGTGSADGGAGMGDGGAGVVTSPSLDNAGSGGGGSGTGIADDSGIPEASAPTNVSPWASLLSMAMMLVILAGVLAVIGAALVQAGRAGSVIFGSGAALIAVGMALCVAAMLLGAAVMVIGGMLMTSYGQNALGGIYLIGGGVAIAAGAAGMGGSVLGGTTTALWLGGATAAIGLIGSMLGGK